MENETDISVKIEEFLESSVTGPYALIVFFVKEWNDDLSPWDFYTPYGQSFGHGGKDTLDWIKNHVIPFSKTIGGSDMCGIAGYSLSGLFSLWSFHSNTLFKGVACCSGSLWFEGWDEFAEKNPVGKDRVAYLSLGGKEPGSGNPLTASIGEQYTKERKRLSKISKVKFESNPGGHFSNPLGRTLKGIAWLIEELQRRDKT
ncbi:MAG: esterase [archaeon]|nr:esterase [archaeon]